MGDTIYIKMTLETTQRLDQMHLIPCLLALDENMPPAVPSSVFPYVQPQVSLSHSHSLTLLRAHHRTGE